MSQSEHSAGLPGAPRCSEAATGNETRPADSAAACRARAIQAAEALPPFSDRTLLEMLWGKAQDRCNPQERAWLVDGALDMASRLAADGQEVATSLALLASQDARDSGGCGALRSEPGVSATLLHFGALLDRIHGLLELANMSEVQS